MTNKKKLEIVFDMNFITGSKQEVFIRKRLEVSTALWAKLLEFHLHSSHKGGFGLLGGLKQQISCL
jgi:hypothetical protein